MDDATHEAIRKLAEENGLDPKALETAFTLDGIPNAIRQDMEAALADVGHIARALGEPDKQSK